MFLFFENRYFKSIENYYYYYCFIFFQCTHLSMTSLSVLNTLIKMDNQV